jgi:hypothetical protein
MDIIRQHTLSEEYYSSSPDTQSIVKTMIGAIPTSKYKIEYNNLDVYNASSPNTKTNMETYGLIPPNIFQKKEIT